MLEHVFGSRTRVKLMSLFLHHPDDMFFVRELTRSIDTQINAVRREIDNLVKLGLIIEGTAQGDEATVKRPGLKRKYYIANKNFVLMHEIRSLLTKAHVLLEWELDKKVKALGDVRYLAFMGAFMGQKGQPVDLFIVGDLENAGLKDLMGKLEKELGFEINYTCMPTKEFTYRTEMADRFLQSILEAPKSVSINLIDHLK